MSTASDSQSIENQVIDRYAVVGNPIAHSKSPAIHARFADQTKQSLCYVAQLVTEGEFKQAADIFFHAGGRGLNITVPFKLDAWAYADQQSARAKRAAAVNTLIKQEDGSVLGDNTDGCGLYRDITDNLGWEIAGKSVLVLGAGGAVRGVLEPLLAGNPKKIVVANRTVEKAQGLAEQFRDLGDIVGCGFADLNGEPFDLVINGTSASLQGDLPPLPSGLFTENGCSYDMMYGAETTVFNQWAKEQGVTRIADGLGMLVEQAAESFRLWRGIKPETKAVISDLRAQL